VGAAQRTEYHLVNYICWLVPNLPEPKNNGLKKNHLLKSYFATGTALGTVASMLSSGVLAGLCGWESIFYVMGAVAFLWCILWEFLVADSPSKQRHITQKERALIENALAGQLEHAEVLCFSFHASSSAVGIFGELLLVYAAEFERSVEISSYIWVVLRDIDFSRLQQLWMVYAPD